MPKVTRETIVKEALEYCAEAAAIFARHGVNPLDRCTGIYDMTTIGEVEEWCALQDVDGLVAELNAAIEKQQSGHVPASAR